MCRRMGGRVIVVGWRWEGMGLRWGRMVVRWKGTVRRWDGSWDGDGRGVRRILGRFLARDDMLKKVYSQEIRGIPSHQPLHEDL